ncbi:MAG: TIR domain-containing protein [Armatimonadota bacterium]
MAYRNGTYIAFDGLGETNPVLSDFKYFADIKAWNANNNIEFAYVDSHEKTYAVRDTSLDATLESRIKERLSYSKNMVVILSSDTRKSGSKLSYEIENAVDNYKLPLIIAYVEYKAIADPQKLSSYWPTALSKRINNTTANAIHIPFAKNALLDAIGQFDVLSMKLNGSVNHYSHEAHEAFGYLTCYDTFCNIRK